MTDWFRSWHGAPTDPKWLGVAKRAKVAPGMAAAIAWALMDRASQANDRGSIVGYDADGLACFFGLEVEEVDAVVDAMRSKGILEADRFTAWETRQPKREDDSAPRVKAFRKRNVTQCNADETLCNAPETETEKKESSLRSDLSSPAESGPAIDAPEIKINPKSKPKASDAEADAAVDGFLDGWAVLAAQCGLAGYRAITDARRARILARARDLTSVLDFPDAATGFADLFARIRGSPFLLGQSGNRAWKCDLDWIIAESNFLKVMEGKYAAPPKPSGQFSPQRQRA